MSNLDLLKEVLCELSLIKQFFDKFFFSDLHITGKNDVQLNFDDSCILKMRIFDIF